MKKIILVGMVVCCLSLSACGGSNSTATEDTNNATESNNVTEPNDDDTQDIEERKEVDGAVFESKEYKIQYKGIGTANSAVAENSGTDDYKKIRYFYFDFENINGSEKQPINAFNVKIYQDGTECKGLSSWTTGSVPEELDNSFTNTIKGGKITFCIPAILKDENGSVLMKIAENGGDYQEYPDYTIDLKTGEGAEAKSKDEKNNEDEQSSEKTNESSSIKKEKIKNFSVGDVIKTDDYEATISTLEFSHDVTPADTSGYYMSYPADSGKVYIHVKCEVKNLMKRDICLRDLFSVGAKYDGEYGYNGFTALDTGNNLLDASSWIVAEPLSTGTVHGIIECPEEVETSSKPLLVHIRVSNDLMYENKMR